jgi:photosystem II stability/assembly factor-like uncharacterized protein
MQKKTQSKWQQSGPIAQGGSVFDIEVSSTGQRWLASGAGILRQTEHGWEPIPQSRPLPVISALRAAPGRDIWWAAGLGGNLLRSQDAGQAWQAGWLDQVTEPIICLAVSPRYSTDHTVLAGTNGAGVLRSTNGGRRWLLSNFGLQNFTILGLAMATDWSRREVVFAGTLAGVYRSSGGGRAWKQVGLADKAIQTLAASDQFVENGLVLVGSEAQGLYRSVDGGRSWQPASGGLAPDVTVNALLNYRDSEGECWLAGTDEGHIWRSVDDGQSWTNVWSGTASVLALAGGPDLLLAGLSEQGLLASADGGRSWRIDTSLCGRGFQRLLTAADGRLFAIAPNDGAWSSADNGQSWDRSLVASMERPLLTLAVVEQVWLAAWTDGLWRCREGQDWQPVLTPTGAPLLALATNPTLDSPMWAAAADCQVWRSVDAGLTWQPVAAPDAGQQLLALAITPKDTTPVLCAWRPTPRGGALTLWRLRADKWEQELHRPMPRQPYVRLATGHEGTESIWLSIDTELWHYSAAEWRQVATFDDPIRQIAVDPAGQSVYILAGPTIFANNTGEDWTPVALPGEATQLLDLQVLPTGELLALDLSSFLWRTPLY